MENEKLENAKIGEKKEPIQPGTFIVTGYRVEKVHNSNGEEIGDKLLIACEHSDAGVIELSKVSYLKNNKVSDSGLWVQFDQNSNLPYTSALSNLLRFYKCESVKDLLGKQVTTVLDSNGYLIVKAY